MKKITATKYAYALWQVLKPAEKSDYEGIMKNFLKLLSQHKALPQLDKIMKKLEQLIDETQGVKKVEVTSAHGLTAELKGFLQKSLSHDLDKKVEISSQVDESMIGGLVIRYDDVLIDGSVSRQLKVLSENLNK